MFAEFGKQRRRLQAKAGQGPEAEAKQKGPVLGPFGLHVDAGDRGYRFARRTARMISRYTAKSTPATGHTIQVKPQRMVTKLQPR